MERQHSNNLLNFLNEDRSRQKFCDVFVSVGGKTYSAHKVVLAHGSSYFHAELSKNPSAKTHVTLEHVEDSVFQHLLSFLYTAECVVAETALPLLCKDGEVQPVSVIQTQVETIASHKVETTSNNSPGADTEINSPADVQGNLFGHDNSNQGQLAESVHTDVHQEASNEEEKTTGQGSATTRRSARRRRTPTKYKRNDGEYISV
uniref:BTB domain-containing protein n=1 Tax=Maylandia zebra TaxID=106582 RepID=A0A3P9BIJ5_9CICH